MGGSQRHQDICTCCIPLHEWRRYRAILHGVHILQWEQDFQGTSIRVFSLHYSKVQRTLLSRNGSQASTATWTKTRLYDRHWICWSHWQYLSTGFRTSEETTVCWVCRTHGKRWWLSISDAIGTNHWLSDTTTVYASHKELDISEGWWGTSGKWRRPVLTFRCSVRCCFQTWEISDNNHCTCSSSWECQTCKNKAT